MEIAPILLAGGSTLFTSINTYLLRRQSHKLRLLKGRYELSLDETKKCIKEKDKMVEYVYQLYNISIELYQTLSAVTTIRDYTPQTDAPVHTSLHHSTVYVDPHADVTTDTFYNHWNKDTHPTHTLAFSCSTHEDTNACVYLLAQLLATVEEQKHKKNAIHAFHAGRLHTVIEALTHFLNTTPYSHLHIPTVTQKSVGTQMRALNKCARQSDASFRELTQEWLRWIAPTAHQHPLLSTGRNSHDTLTGLLSNTDQSNLLSHYLLSEKVRDSLAATSSPSPSPSPPKHQRKRQSPVHRRHLHVHHAGNGDTAPFDGIHCLTRSGRISEHLVTHTHAATALVALHHQVSPFNTLYDRFHHTLAHLATARTTFLEATPSHTLLLGCVWWKLIRTHHTLYASRVPRAIRHLLRNQPTVPKTILYRTLKHHLRQDKKTMQRTKKHLHQLTHRTSTQTREKQWNTFAAYLYNVYAQDMFGYTIQIHHPEWIRLVEHVKQLVESASQVIERDLTFRRSLIETHA